MGVKLGDSKINFLNGNTSSENCHPRITVVFFVHDCFYSTLRRPVSSALIDENSSNQ
jgi:hypothetical protein